jgi:DNA topoisomerase I
MGATRDLIKKEFGNKYLPGSPRYFKSKSKNAQEAHEAIRPTNVGTKADDIRNIEGMSRDHVRLYDLIWKRLLASQMSEALFNQTSVDVKSGDYRQSLKASLSAAPSSSAYKLRANGSVILFDGWLKLYGASTLEEDTPSGQEQAEGEEKKQILPPLKEGEDLKLLELLEEQHFTQPPPRYTEASLIKKLEELGIGRPSTYAPILSTIQDRFYVEREERKFKPSPLGLAVSDFLIKYFPNVFDYKFTAQMEDALDEVARGERKWKETIAEFYKPFE